MLEAFVDVRPRAVDRRGARRATATTAATRSSRTTTATASCAAPSRRPPVSTRRCSGPREAHAHALMAELGYVGVLAIELFQVGGSLLGNEMAPAGAQLRALDDRGGGDRRSSRTTCARSAVCRSGSSESVGVSAMVNLIGEMPDRADVLARAGRPPARLRQGAAPGPQARPRDHPCRRRRAARGAVAGGARAHELMMLAPRSSLTVRGCSGSSRRRP